MITLILFIGLIGVVFFSLYRFFWFDRSRHSPWAEWFDLLPWLALGATLIVTLVTWNQEKQSFSQSAAAEFFSESNKIQEAIAARTQAYEELLAAVQADVSAQTRFENRILVDYVRAQQLDQKHPYVDGVGFAAYVPEKRRARFLAQRRNFKIFPASDRPEAIPVEAAEPENRIGRLVGFDLSSDPDIQAALDQSQRTGTAILSKRVFFPDDPQHAAFLLVLPIVNNPAQSESVTGAPAIGGSGALRGWVFLRFRSDEFLKNVVHQPSPFLQLQVFDGLEMSKSTFFYDSSGYPGDSDSQRDGPFVITRAVDVAGRQWILHFVGRPAFTPTGTASHRSMMVFGFGLFLSAIAFGLVAAVASAQKRAALLAREMTAELEQRTILLSKGPDGVVIVDGNQPDLPILWVNARFEKMTGYSAQEVIGRNCRFLQGEDHDQKGLKDIRLAIREQREGRAMVRNYRKDGTPFWNELTINPVRAPFGKGIQFVGHLHDASDREHSERRLSTQVAVIRALSESPTLEEGAARVLEALCEGQEWELGVFWELDHRNQVLRCLEIWHQPEIQVADFERFSRETTFPREMGLAGQVWAKGEAVWIGDLEKEAELPETPILLRQGLVSGCGFPIASRSGLQGVLTFYSRKIWPLNKNLLLLMVGTSNQISRFMERQQNQGQREEVATLERGLAEFIANGLVAMDREGYCIYANSAAAKMLGYSAPMMLGQNLHELLHPKESVTGTCDSYRCPVIQSLQSTQPCYIEDHQFFYTRDRVALPVSYTTAPIIDHGLIRGVVITMNDVTSYRQRLDEMEKLLQEKDAALQRVMESHIPSSPTIILQAPAPSMAIQLLPPPPPQPPIVLVVEEDIEQRAKFSKQLRALGYRVLDAAHSAEALRLGEENKKIDLLICDCIMTQMSGKLLVERLKTRHSELRVLYVSTYTPQAMKDLGLLNEETPFLQKPFEMELLAGKMHSLLPWVPL